MRVVRVEKFLSGAMAFRLEPYTDDRGGFSCVYRKLDAWNLGLKIEFPEVYYSYSKRGVLRGLHFQLVRPQARLVVLLHGRIMDVLVDLRDGSPTYRQWKMVELSEDGINAVYIPRGFAHGFLTVEDVKMLYFFSDYYYPEGYTGVRWNDPDIGIEWPLERIKGENFLIISEKDRNLPMLREIEYRIRIHFPYSAYPF